MYFSFKPQSDVQLLEFSQEILLMSTLHSLMLNCLSWHIKLMPIIRNKYLAYCTKLHPVFDSISE